MVNEGKIKPPYTAEALLECIQGLESELSSARATINTIQQGRIRDKKRIDDLEAKDKNREAEFGNLRRRLIRRDQKVATDRFDFLMGILRRSAFKTALTQLYTVCVRKDIPLTLLFLDIDYFKAVNDTYGGHAVGDKMLQKCAGIILNSVRDSDLVGRWGGEEIVIALFDTDLQNGLVYAENLRVKHEEELRVIGYQNERPVPVRRTVSIGVAARTGDESPEDLIKRSDLAMYRAKHAGRNRVCL